MLLAWLAWNIPFVNKALKTDEYWMRLALKQATQAALLDEVPVGAVVISPEGDLLAKAANLRESLPSAIGHAELIAIHRASKHVGSWRLNDCTLYVTLEPCPMCLSAIIQARFKRVVFAAFDSKGGALGGRWDYSHEWNTRTDFEFHGGLFEKESAQLLQSFFQKHRDEEKKAKAQRTFRRRSSAVVIHDGKVLGFNAVDPTSGQKFVFLPGGALEKSESFLESAVRETREETGYKIAVDEQTALNRKYLFHWNGKDVWCETVFYLARLDQKFSPPRRQDDADYNLGPVWIPFSEVGQTFAYHPDILWAVSKLIKEYRKRRSSGELVE